MRPTGSSIADGLFRPVRWTVRPVRWTDGRLARYREDGLAFTLLVVTDVLWPVAIVLMIDGIAYQVWIPMLLIPVILGLAAKQRLEDSHPQNGRQ